MTAHDSSARLSSVFLLLKAAFHIKFSHPWYTFQSYFLLHWVGAEYLKYFLFKGLTQFKENLTQNFLIKDSKHQKCLNSHYFCYCCHLVFCLGPQVMISHCFIKKHYGIVNLSKFTSNFYSIIQHFNGPKEKCLTFFVFLF